MPRINSQTFTAIERITEFRTARMGSELCERAGPVFIHIPRSRSIQAFVIPFCVTMPWQINPHQDQMHCQWSWVSLTPNIINHVRCDSKFICGHFKLKQQSGSWAPHNTLCQPFRCPPKIQTDLMSAWWRPGSIGKDNHSEGLGGNNPFKEWREYTKFQCITCSDTSWEIVQYEGFADYLDGIWSVMLFMDQKVK